MKKKNFNNPKFKNNMPRRSFTPEVVKDVTIQEINSDFFKKTVSVTGIIEKTVQTSGPTIFVISDGTRVLSLKGFEFISRQAGNIAIKEKQLIEINRVYTLFDEINKDILHIREAKYQGKSISELHEKLVELQNRCFTIAGEYLNKYSHNK